MKPKRINKAKEARKILKSMDNTWRIAVNIAFNYKCAICNRSKEDGAHLDAHHIISRTVKGLRHDLDNGILLCKLHHMFSKINSAHKGGLAFHCFLISTYPEKVQYLLNKLKEIEDAK